MTQHIGGPFFDDFGLAKFAGHIFSRFSWGDWAVEGPVRLQPRNQRCPKIISELFGKTGFLVIDPRDFRRPHSCECAQGNEWNQFLTSVGQNESQRLRRSGGRLRFVRLEHRNLARWVESIRQEVGFRTEIEDRPELGKMVVSVSVGSGQR